MRVAVDGRALRAGTARARGVARYLRCLLEQFDRACGEDHYEVVDPGRLGLATAAVAGRPRLDRLAGGCDVAWVPAPAPVAVSPEVPFVLTVHDLSFEHRARDYPLYDRAWLRLARPRTLARRAALVVCVSEETRRAVISEWEVDQARARTVLLGPGRAPGPPEQPGEELPERFILAVGALEPRKRPLLVAEAHRRAAARGLGAGLVFAGDGPLRRRVERSGAHVLGHVPDAVLDGLYERALAVVCPSREEGFGFTPLEALARGTPAVVSDLAVFGETLGDGALRVPPGDPEALAEALLRIDADPALRERLSEAGRAAAARLSWERTVQEKRAILAEAAGTR
jgi:glycosyltransferase involved in cell wall biosynthesis